MRIYIFKTLSPFTYYENKLCGFLRNKILCPCNIRKFINFSSVGYMMVKLLVLSATLIINEVIIIIVKETFLCTCCGFILVNNGFIYVYNYLQRKGIRLFDKPQRYTFSWITWKHANNFCSLVNTVFIRCHFGLFNLDNVSHSS